jgi:hypothetical protein
MKLMGEEVDFWLVLALAWLAWTVGVWVGVVVGLLAAWLWL